MCLVDTIYILAGSLRNVSRYFSVLSRDKPYLHASIVACWRASMSLDSRSRSSSVSIERDLEEARQRLVLHQYDQDECNTENEVHVRTGLEHPHGSGLPPTPLRNGNYGSVSTLQSIQQKAPPKVKRYRIPFLVLMAFDFGMVIFLSIICSEVSLVAHIYT